MPEPDNWDPTANPSPPPNPANTVTISKTFTALDEIIITLPYNYTGGQGSPSPYTTFVIQESFTNLTGVDLSAVTIELGVIDISGTGFNCTGVAVNFCRDSFGGSTAEFTPFSTVSGLPHFSNVLGISDQATLTGLLANGDVANLLFEVSIPANNPESNWAIRQTVIPEPGTAALLALGLAGLAWFAHR